MARPRIVIVGAGFAGYHAARVLSRLARGRAEVVVINPTDYFLYLPLLAEVAVGLLEPRRVTVSVSDTLPDVRLVLGEVDRIDLASRRVRWVDPDHRWWEAGYDRLMIAVGSVNKLLPIPGVAEHAHGLRGMPEALFLRDHLTRQIELADEATDPRERAARCTFVVVGGGFTGTEVAAQGVLYTDVLYERHPGLGRQRPYQIAPMTAQHAQRQGKQAGYNIAASYGQGGRRPYTQHDLGRTIDLGGTRAAANPAGLPLTGVPAKAVTRGYHLLALPGNRTRVTADWTLDAALTRPTVQLGVIPAQAVPLDTTSPELPAWRR